MVLQRYTTPLLLLFLYAFHRSQASSVMDLSEDYKLSDSYNSDQFSNLLNLAETQDDVIAMIAVEGGEIVAEYYEDFSPSQKFDIWSGTKSWVSLLFGIMEKEELIRVDETLGDIFPDPAVWKDVEDADLRRDITVEYLLQMRAGLSMPK